MTLEEILLPIVVKMDALTAELDKFPPGTFRFLYNENETCGIEIDINKVEPLLKRASPLSELTEEQRLDFKKSLDANPNSNAMVTHWKQMPGLIPDLSELRQTKALEPYIKTPVKECRRIISLPYPSMPLTDAAKQELHRQLDGYLTAIEQQREA